MNDNFQMSPLARVLMNILHKGAWGAAALLVLFGAIFTWQQRQPDGSFDFNRQDWGFLGVVAALALLAFYLVRSIGKEMQKPGG
jgi:drug/metabolite transporter (DMT)-like permease